MKGVLFYLVQLIACSGFLYGYYHFALRNKKFHQYNRYYLLLASFISVIVPFLNIPVVLEVEHEQPSVIVQTLTAISSNGINDPIRITNLADGGTMFTLENISLLFYLLIAFFIFIRVIHGLIHIKQLLKKYSIERIGQLYFVNTEESGTPFSFLKWLFWNKKIDLRSESGEQIFRHELFHIQQKHSWDLLFIEGISVLFWINPFFFLITKELKIVHEFLADEFATKEKDKWDYAEVLLMQVLGSHDNRLVNSFFHNQIKRRIAMITSSQKTSYQYFRKMMVLPVAAIAIALFAFRYRTINQIKDASAEKVKIVNDAKPFLGNAVVYRAETSNSDYTSKPIKIKIDGADTSKPSNILIVIDGKEQKPGMTIKDLDQKVKVDDIQKMNVLKDKAAVAKYGEKGKNGVIEIFTKTGIEDINIETVESNIHVDNVVSEKFDSTVIKEEINNQVKVDNIIFEKVEIDPFFPGGEIEWREFLLKNLKETVPADKDAPAGSYTVWLRFIVDRDGTVSNVQALTNHGYGMEEEGVRVMKLSPKWNPAMQNGHIVKSYRKQPITFVVGKSKAASSKDYNDPANWNYRDPAFLEWRQRAVSEVKAIAIKEGKVAYKYKGRTYVFSRINNPDPLIASFTEQDGVNHVFLVNGELVRSIEEINKRFTRNDVIKLSLIPEEEGLKRFNIHDRIVSLETFDNSITKK